MQNRLLGIVLFLSMISVFAQAVEPENEKLNFLSSTSAWEIGITGDYAREGENGDKTESAMGVGLRGAYRFFDYFSAVLEYKYWSNVENKGMGGSTDIHRFIASLNADLWPEKRHSPYIIAGLGYEKYPDKEKIAHEDGVILNLGFGYRFMVVRSVSILGEIKWRSNIDQGSDEGGIVTLGANYHF